MGQLWFAVQCVRLKNYKMAFPKWVRPNLAEPYLVDPHLVAIVSKFPVWSTVLFGRHLFGRLNYLVDTSLVDYL